MTLVEQIRARPHDAPIPTEYLLDDAADHIELLETTLRSIQDACARYVHPASKMTAEELALIVIGEADSVKVVKALEGRE